MSGLTVGTLSAILDLDADPFTKTYERVLGKTEQDTARRMEQLGGKMTKGITLPLLAAGGAAVKLGTDFDTAFARAVGLAGVASDQVEGLKDRVLDLAGKTATAPQELADAFYDAASAGLETEQAMQAVEIAARGAAAGMGTTGDIVGLVASATASYGSANIDAARAVDILTATIRAGRADPAELAGTLGRILPVAAQLGVSFDEVGGATAYLSNVFGDTNRTVTALSGFLIKLVSPSQQGRKALEDMGTSVEELQGAIQRDGLMGALDLLREKGFAGNQQALRALFDDIEGFQGALALLNDKSGTLNETMAETRDSTGALGDAFDAADTDGRKMKQALVDLQVAAIKAGEIIGPFVATVASGISSVADAFASLPAPAQTVILVMAGVLASVGPLVSIGGKIAQNWQRISSVFETVALKAMYAKDNLGGLARTVGTGTAAVAAGAMAWQLYSKMMDDARSRGRGAVDDIRKQFAGIPDAEMSMQKLRDVIGGMDNDLASLSDTIAGSQAPWDMDKRTEMKAQREEATKLRDEWKAMEQAAIDLAAEMGISTDEALRSILANEDLTAAASDTGEAFDSQSAAVKATVDALNGYSSALAAMFDPLFGAQDAAWKLKDAQDAVTEALARNSDGIKDNNVSQEELSRLQAEAVRAAANYEGSLANLKAEIESGSTSLDTAKATLQRWVEQGIITQAQADAATWSFGMLKGSADALPAQVGIAVEVDTSTAEGRIAALKASLASVPKMLPVNFIGPTLPGQYRAQGPVPARASGGPVWPGDFLVGEEGPEVVRFGAPGHVFDAPTSAKMMQSSGAGTTLVDRSTFAPQITTGMDPAETFAVLDRYTRQRFGKSLADVVRG